MSFAARKLDHEGVDLVAAMGAANDIGTFADEFLTCPLPEGLFNTTLQDGPGIIINDKNQIISIDPGLIQP